MGCDIHEWVERKAANGWEMTDVNLNIGRNYDLFGMLADVRNGVGFAGVDMGDGFVPVLGRGEPTRGVPDDASPEYRSEVESWECDGHSHSWLTLAELKAYDWRGQRTKQRGIVSLDERKKWRDRDGDRPKEYCGGVSGRSVKVVSLLELDRIIDEGQPQTWSYYAKCEWEVSYYETARTFVDETIPKLEAYAREHGLSDDDARMVFFFDN